MKGDNYLGGRAPRPGKARCPLKMLQVCPPTPPLSGWVRIGGCPYQLGEGGGTMGSPLLMLYKKGRLA